MASSLTDGLPPDKQQHFELLRQRFIAGLSMRWIAISQATDAVSRQTLLHRLGGIAGSFGFERLGQLSRKAEQICALGDVVALAQCLNQIDDEIRWVTGTQSSSKGS